MSRYTEIDLSKITPLSVKTRPSKLDSAQLARPLPPGSSLASFLDSLPKTLAAQDFHALVRDLVTAKRSGKPVIVMMGAHVIKVGLGPLIIDLLTQGLLDAIAVNGAVAIHDAELACFGRTSEDVAEMLRDGRFGMSKETAELLNGAADKAADQGLGLGEALGARLLDEKAPHADHSVLAQAYRLGVPVTVHVALGTDIVHQHPGAQGAAIGEASLRDFRILADRVRQLHGGGVAMLWGSAVVLPEVFLKALTVARNVAGPVDSFVTANFDMIRHYRPQVNVLERPTQNSGRSYRFTGHHEIMIPLLAAAWKEALAADPTSR